MMPNKLDVYLDDERETPVGWHRCHKIYQVMTLLRAGRVRKLSLDYDLGDGERNGHQLLMWMTENSRWPDEEPTVHSTNPVGAEAMRYLIGKWFGKKYGKERPWKSS